MLLMQQGATRGLNSDPKSWQLRPRFFESGGRPIYGLCCEPTRKDLKPAAVVACHSYGPEQAVGSRMIALAVREAAAIGFTAVAYHARGHGDSAGDLADVTFETMVHDALCAADQITAERGPIKIIWLGLRFGALVAAAAAARRGAQAIVLWEPVHTGAGYFAELIRSLRFSEIIRRKQSGMTIAHAIEQLESNGHIDLLGSYLHGKFYNDARNIRLADLMNGWCGPTFLAQIQPRMTLLPDNKALATELERRGAIVNTLMVREEPGWYFPTWLHSWTDPHLLATTGAWLDAVA